MKRLLAVAFGAAMLFARAIAVAQDAKPPSASGNSAATTSMP
jgi:hypothetical protein